jgi:hypothetical protein
MAASAPRCGGRAAVDDVIAKGAFGGGGIRDDGNRGAPLATAGRSRRLRADDGLRDALAGFGGAVGGFASPGRRTRQMASRIDPMPRRRKRGFYCGRV